MVLTLFAALPRRPAASLGRALAGFVGPRLSRQHARAIARTWPSPSRPSPKLMSKTLRRRICSHFGQVLSTYANLPPLLSRNGFGGIVDVKGANHLAEAARSGPFLLVGAHFGHWELPGYYAAISGCRMSVLYTPISNPWIDRAMARLRRKANAQFDLIPLGPAAARKMMAGLSGCPSSDGRRRPQPPARLARRFNCPLLLGRAVLLPQDR
jgi:lauroyl/myristoyl acyltransferase